MLRDLNGTSCCAAAPVGIVDHGNVTQARRGTLVYISCPAEPVHARVRYGESLCLCSTSRPGLLCCLPRCEFVQSLVPRLLARYYTLCGNAYVVSLGRLHMYIASNAKAMLMGNLTSAQWLFRQTAHLYIGPCLTFIICIV